MRVDLQKHSHLVIILLSALVGMFLMAMFIYVPRDTPARAQETMAGAPANWQTAFSTVAKNVLPAVVSIQGKTEVSAPQGAPDWFKGFPFFFGPGDNGDNSGGQTPGQPPKKIERPFLGSGWIYSEDGYIITNAHVVKNATGLKVQLHDTADDTPVPATVIGYDARSDLGVIKVDVKRKLPFLQLASSRDAQVGQWVMAVGSPFSEELQQTVTQGIISAKGRVLAGAAQELGAIGASIGDVIQTDAAINPGNSGGPLVDLAGRVIGINESIISPNGAMGGNVGIGFAISSDTAARVLPQLIKNKRVVRGWLGITIGDLNENKRDFYKAPQGGALVNSVNPDGPAAKSGLQADDVIVSAGGEPVHNTWDLQNATGNTAPGNTLPLTVIRDGKQIAITVRVGEMPEKYVGGPQTAPEEVPQAADPLGLQVQTLLPNMPQAQDLGLTKGVLVVAVDPNGPSADSLKAGDVITEVNRTKVDNADGYRAALDVSRKLKAKYVIVRLTRRQNGDLFTAPVDVVPNW
ncbi:MAG TPA: trypsin-like peptidase domain-containing protein [Armatimonadota bacterium]|jgi:serine protease Do